MEDSVLETGYRIRKTIAKGKDSWNKKGLTHKTICILLAAYILKDPWASIGIRFNELLSKYHRTELGWEIISFITIVIIGALITGWISRDVRLENSATRDKLTKLRNRRYLEEEQEFVIAQARREKKKVCYMSGDLDGLKFCNDTYGHPAGDKYIILSAETLTKLTRQTDLVARTGGDEFAILYILNEDEKDSPELLKKKIQAAFEEKYLNLADGKKIPLSISIGYAIYDPNHDIINVLEKEADVGMYKDKAERRKERRD